MYRGLEARMYSANDNMINENSVLLLSHGIQSNSDIRKSTVADLQ